MTLENQAKAFSIFHDGSINNLTRIRNDIELIIEIQYLAQMINPKFTIFKCNLENCTKFEYHTWSIENGLIDNLDILTKLDLEIYDAKVVNDSIKIICFSDDKDYSGDLVIIADDIIISDENNQVITLSKLTELCKLYWGN